MGSYVHEVGCEVGQHNPKYKTKSNFTGGLGFVIIIPINLTILLGFEESHAAYLVLRNKYQNEAVAHHTDLAQSHYNHFVYQLPFVLRSKYTIHQAYC